MKTDRFAHMRTIPADYEQKINVSEMKGIGLRIATAMINEWGFYTCLIGGKKTLVVR